MDATASNYCSTCTIDNGLCADSTPVCEDNDSAMSAFGGCVAAVAALGCDFVFAGSPISDSCPVSCDNCPTYGCTDATACNYDDAADTDDGMIVDDNDAMSAFGGCVGAVAALGCDFVFAGSPISDSCPVSCGCPSDQEVSGCTDYIACNYNENATDDDSSCVYATGCDSCSGEIDGTGTVVDNDTDDDGICDQFEIAVVQMQQHVTMMLQQQMMMVHVYDNDLGCGCDTPAAADGYDCDGNCLVDTDGDGICDQYEIAGCTDATACNYDASATDDDGSCYDNDLGCGCDTPAAADGYDCDGNCLVDDDGVCDVDEIAGCTDATACNYDASATDDDGSC